MRRYDVGDKRTLAAALAFPAVAVLTTLLLTTVLVGRAPARTAETVEVVDVGVAMDPAAPPEAVESARQATRALMQGLLGELSAAMEEGGPSQAVEVCSERAPGIAAAHSVDGLQVGRTSARLRNPDNAPDAFEEAWLARLEELHAAGDLPQEVARVVDGEEGPELRYLKPIVIQADLCLQCHGAEETLSPEVRRVLAERYPDDRATGYEKGDLRGVVTVRVPLEAPR